MNPVISGESRAMTNSNPPMDMAGKAGRPLRILLAKPGLDGHDRGVKVLALSLRDAGFEVLYTGLHRSCEEIVRTAIQEDVDVIGVSMLSGGQYAILSALLALLRKEDAADIAVIAGGFLPDQEEILALKKLGVLEVFDTDTKVTDVVSYLRNLAGQRQAAGS